MSNQALCENLYQRGYQLYLKSYQDTEKRINDNRKEIDEDYYAAMSLDQLTKLAESGNHEAQFCLGTYYADRDDTSTAFSWFERSAAGGEGCVDAMETLAGFYIYGINGWPKDSHKALIWLKCALIKGCSAFTLQLLCDLYLTKENPQYADYSTALPWLMFYASWMHEDPEEGLNSAVRVVNLLQLLIEIDLDVSHAKPLDANYQEIEDWALLCYYWQGLVQDLGQKPNDEGAIPTCKILCQIGECAYAMQKPYANAVLREAMERGSDFAAVLLIPDAIDKAMDIRTTPMGPTLYRVVGYQVFASNPVGPNQLKMANAYVKEYFLKVERAASSKKYGSFRQAEALYRLSHCYLVGLCCKRNVNAAHDCLERAAKLDHNGAKKLLSHFHRKFPFGWEFH